MTETTTHPDLVYDPVVGSFLHKPTGMYHAAPPTKHYRYFAVEPFRIEQTIFKPGDLLGEGNVEPGYNGPAYLLTFEPAEGVGVAIGAGHVVPRLQAGAIRAEPID